MSEGRIEGAKEDLVDGFVEGVLVSTLEGLLKGDKRQSNLPSSRNMPACSAQPKRLIASLCL